MKININFQEQGLVRLDSNCENISFGINWQDQDIYYPDKNWSDLGIAVLSCWIGTIIELIEEKDEGQFPFLDGPYFLIAKYNRRTGMLHLSPKGVNTQSVVKLADFINELIIAINQIKQELTQRNIREKDKKALEKGLVILNKYLFKIEL